MSKNPAYLPVLQNYVPRHLRVGVNLVLPELGCKHTKLEKVPVLGENGQVVSYLTKTTRVPVSETIGKLNVNDWTIEKLQLAGVPLRIIQINKSLSSDIDSILAHCESLEQAEQYVQKVVELRSSAAAENNENVELKNE